MKMQVRVLRRKPIKPCTPTPSHLRTYTISIFDELNEAMHIHRTLYFSSDTINVEKQVISLEESLAKILPLFYPLAGRYIKEKSQVDCNDSGAEYVEAQVDCNIHQLIHDQVIPEEINKLLPVDVIATDELTDPILAVQINKFKCGGVAIAVCVSHRIFDSASLGMFLQAWANAAVGGDLDFIRPDFTSSSLFPAENLAPFELGTSRAGDDSILVRRFMFDQDAISKLRDNFRPGWRSSVSCGERPPSRIVVLSAFLTQVILRADRIKNGKSRASLIAQAINVRERTVPPIPKYACGTWVSSSFLENTASESRSLEYDFRGMVSKMRESTMQGVRDCARILSDKKFGRSVMIDNNLDAANKTYSGDYKVIWMTDWSKFGEYELDFGFGKPIWVSLVNVPVQDLCVLMNTKDNDGIEAWVYLQESDMHYFQQDEDLKTLITKL